MKILKMDDEYNTILNKYHPQTSAYPGACFILPDGRFLNVKTHGSVDEFIINEFGYDIEDCINNYPNGIMVDKYNCFRINNGATLSGDKYIQLPKRYTNEQLYALEDWLDDFVYYDVTVESPAHDLKTYDVSQTGTDYVMNRVKRYFNSGKLLENVIRL